MIASEVRELVFQREIESWGVRSGCLNDVYFQEAERGETYDRRLKEMEDWGNILTSLDGDLDFAKRMRVRISGFLNINVKRPNMRQNVLLGHVDYTELHIGCAGLTRS